MSRRARLGEAPTPRLRDVARLAGVSEATASRVLGDSRHVRPEMRVRVLESAAKLNYEPNPHARALPLSHSGSMAVIVHDVSDPYFLEILRGVLEGAEEAAGRILLICDTYRDVSREGMYIRHFRAQRAEVLILAGSGTLDREASAHIAEEVLGFERVGGRAVLIGRHHGTGDTVLPDNSNGARLLARHLVSLGHHRIGVITGLDSLRVHESITRAM